MSKLKWLAILICLLMTSSAWGQRMAHDTTMHTSYYATYGWRFAAAMKHAVDRSAIPESLVQHVLDNAGTARNQLQRRVNTVPITLVTSGEDSLESCVLGVPTGYTATITGLYLTAFTEVSGNNDSAWAEVLWYNAGTLDTMVARFPIDADSANYDNNLLELTRIDSSLAAGDVIFWRTIALEGAATGAVGAALVVEYLLDE